jgi:hypothetical protein
LTLVNGVLDIFDFISGNQLKAETGLDQVNHDSLMSLSFAMVNKLSLLL